MASRDAQASWITRYSGAVPKAAAAVLQHAESVRRYSHMLREAAGEICRRAEHARARSERALSLARRRALPMREKARGKNDAAALPAALAQFDPASTRHLHNQS